MSKGVQDVSDPLKHLFSLDFSRTSPLLNETSLDEAARLSDSNSPKRVKKVRFADPFADESRNHETEPLVDVFQVKGILKKKLSVEESEYALSNLSLEESYSDDYSEISSSIDDSSIDENEFSETVSENVPPQDVSGKEENVQKEDLQDTLTQNDLDVANKNNGNVLETSKDNVGMQISDDDIQIDARFGSIKQEFYRPYNSEIHEGDSVEFSANKNILQILSKVKAESIDIHRKHDHVRPVSFSRKKPKLHLCVTSLFKQDFSSSGSNNLQNSKFSNAQMAVLNDRLKGHTFEEEVSFIGSLTSQQTLKLQSFLRANSTIDISSAKELKSAVFSAWNKVKNAEKSVANCPESNNSKKFSEKKVTQTSAAAKGYMYWKKRRESLKTKKHYHPKLKFESNTSDKILSEEEKTKTDEERILAYKFWKQKKDEQLRLRLQNEHKRAKVNNANSLKQEEIRKKDAASAFHAWKIMKLNSQIEKQEQINNNQMKIDQEKLLEEKAERDKESQDAYFLWLQQKERLKHDITSTGNDRPPWNPPG